MNSGMNGFSQLPLSAGGKLKTQEFLTSGVWVKPPNVESVFVIIVGGGGGGGSQGRGNVSGTTYISSLCEGGSGSEVKSDLFSVSGNLTITVGQGGQGGTAVALGTPQGNDGSNGGDSLIISSTGATIVTAKGGYGGKGGYLSSSGNITQPNQIMVQPASTYGMSLGGNFTSSGERIGARKYHVDTVPTYLTYNGLVQSKWVFITDGEPAISTSFGYFSAGGAASYGTNLGALGFPANVTVYQTGTGKGGSGIGGNANLQSNGSPIVSGGNASENTGSGGAGAGGCSYLSGYSDTGSNTGGKGANGYVLIAWVE